MLQISDNTLFYTLSTVAQSVAAVIAFLGAFVLFKIQGTEVRIVGTFSVLAGQITMGASTSNITMLIRSGQYDKALGFVCIDPKHMGPAFQSSYEDIIQSIQSLQRIRKDFAVTLYLAVALIVGSIIGLALVDQKCASPVLNISFGLYIAFSIFVLVRAATLMRKMIYEK